MADGILAVVERDRNRVVHCHAECQGKAAARVIFPTTLSKSFATLARTLRPHPRNEDPVQPNDQRPRPEADSVFATAMPIILFLESLTLVLLVALLDRWHCAR